MNDKHRMTVAEIKASLEERGIDARHAFGVMYERAEQLERSLADEQRASSEALAHAGEMIDAKQSALDAMTAARDYEKQAHATSVETLSGEKAKLREYAEELKKLVDEALPQLGYLPRTEKGCDYQDDLRKRMRTALSKNSNPSGLHDADAERTSATSGESGPEGKGYDPAKNEGRGTGSGRRHGRPLDENGAIEFTYGDGSTSWYHECPKFRRNLATPRGKACECGATEPLGVGSHGEFAVWIVDNLISEYQDEWGEETVGRACALCNAKGPLTGVFTHWDDCLVGRAQNALPEPEPELPSQGNPR